MEIGALLLGIAIGLLIGWLTATARSRTRLESERLEAITQRSAAESAAGELRAQLATQSAELAELRTVWQRELAERAAADARAIEINRSLEQQRRLLEQSETRLREAFAALASESLQRNSEQFMRQTDERVRPLRESLAQFEQLAQSLEQARQNAYGRVATQLEQLGESHSRLSQHTSALVGALRTPQVRGRWGEVTLRRVVELAGLTRHCDYEEQRTVEGEEGRKRPDLLVRLPGGRLVVVDAKAPLSAFLESLEAPTPEQRTDRLVQHARQLRAHMKSLSAKAYWQQFDQTPDFVVLFVPGESFFAAALEQDGALLEDGMRDRVILATPTTLIALLRTVAYSWQQQELVDNARQIGETARILYERVCKFVEHMQGVRDGLERATKAYNAAAGSWESRVLPMGARIAELGVDARGAEFPTLAPTDSAPRSLPVDALLPEEDAPSPPPPAPARAAQRAPADSPGLFP